MSRLSDLLRQLRVKEPQLAQDLEREVCALAERRPFGLNFERHVPEKVELPGRRVRKGDTVRVLQPRGQDPRKADDRRWCVVSIDHRAANASLIGLDERAASKAPLDELVVVAEFRDPIYPGLISTGKVERVADKPFHIVINAENYHALETLLFTHRGKVDCVYIDPPYNTGARDWKYNNDYVEGDDVYRHSKWLAFMERRLNAARKLLNPDNSVLIITIDEKENPRLGLLLEQLYPEARIQMVSTVINPKGAMRAAAFGRTDEYIYFVMFGGARPKPLPLGTEWKVVRDARAERLRWAELIRSGTNARRVDRPKLFYPVFVRNTSDGPVFDSVGDPIEGDYGDVTPPVGCVAVWPIRSDGTEGRWQISGNALMQLIEKGYARLGAWRNGNPTITYIAKGEQQKVEEGLFPILGRNADGSIIVDSSSYTPVFVPGTQWRIASHEAGGPGGGGLLRALLPDRRFPFPKSLYAVEDAIRFFVKDKHDAVVLDFFAGSGTTAHAVMRLNQEDGGRRQSISVTNNEVSAEEQVGLRARRLRAGDSDWEDRGVCEHITKPRITAAVTGLTPTGESVRGKYLGSEFPISEGFDENVEFFTLTYENPLRVASNREFKRVAPLLWMRAGSRGRRIDDLPDGWDLTETYGVLVDLDCTEDFLRALAAIDSVTAAFIMSDEDRLFEAIAQELPDRVEPVRLYEAYLRNCEIESARGAL